MLHGNIVELLELEDSVADMKEEAGPNLDDPFGDGDDCHDEVAALAKALEEKYGPGNKKKRKLKCLEDEYFDLGDGYDETDPFIDNTEAYDEVVPSHLTTQLGGFYINRGTLDFRSASDQENSDEEFITPVVKKRGRPRKIIDSDEEERDEGEAKKRKLKKKKDKEGLDGETKKKKKKLSIGPDGEKFIKHKKVINSNKKKKNPPTVKELLKQQTERTASPGNQNGSMDEHSSGSMNHSPQADKSADGIINNSMQEEERKMNGSDFGQNNLPSDLPAELETSIVDIKKAAKDSKEGKCRFFSPQVNKLLLDIELASRQLSHGKRPLIYAHLADHLPCGKETLIKRAKKLRENQMDDKLKQPIQQLKEEIDSVMPALQEQHEEEVAKVRLENREKREGAEPQKEEGVNTESDEEDKMTTPGNVEGQSRKGNRDPRKKFKWTPKIKSLLCEIVTIKMHMFDTYKFRNQTAEEYLRTFLDNEIKVLWPQGWIQTRMLFKETRSVHGSWTNPVKPKRQMLVSRPIASPTPSQSANMPSPITDHNTSPNRPGTAADTGAAEVIEVSDVDEVSVPETKDKFRPASFPALDVSEESPSFMGGDKLKFSPNSVETMAVATAAVVAAAVSTPKTEQPSLGERRPHLMSEILKRPGSADAVGAFPKSVTPVSKTSPPSVSPQRSESSISYFEEFNRYLNNSSSASPFVSPRQGQSDVPRATSQLQSKTVSSSTGRPDDRNLSHVHTVRWPGEKPPLNLDKTRKLSAGSVGKNTVGSNGPPNAHSGHKTTAHPNPGADNMSAQQVLFHKVNAAIGSDSLVEKPQKTKGEIVRDQILAKIHAELEASNSNSGAGAPGLSDISGNRTQTSSSGSIRPPGSLLVNSPARQSPAHGVYPKQSLVKPTSPSASKQTGPGAGPPSRLSPSAVSRQSPSPMPRQSPSPVSAQLPGYVSRKALPPSNKQQTVVSSHQPMPARGGQGVGAVGQSGSSRSLLTTFQPPQSKPPQSSLSTMKKTVPAHLPAGLAQKKAAPLPPVAAPPIPKGPVQRSPTTQTPVRTAASYTQGLKVSAGQGRGTQQSLVSTGTSPLPRTSPTNLTASQRNVTAMQSSPNINTVRKLPSVPQGLQKVSAGTTTVSSSSTTQRSQAVGPKMYQQISNPVKPAPGMFDMQNRISPGQRAAVDKATLLLTASNQVSKAASGTHSQTSGPGTSAPRLQSPATAPTKMAGNKLSAHSGTPNSQQQNSGFSPQAVVPSGLFNHRPVYGLHSHSGPLFKDSPKPPPPPGYGQ